ncbi:hypothetical protein, partial [Streptosporangium minutum]
MYATVTDPESRSSTLSVEVEHDPAATGQGSGLIWSGTSQNTFTSGSEGNVSVPAGKLSDGWKLRWRARATAGGINGAWSPWSTFSVELSKPSVSALNVWPHRNGAATTLTPGLYATVTDPESRSSTLSVEVEHDPAATGQGSGLIWSGTSQNTFTSGSEGNVSVPAGKLSDGWKLRWRARATAGGINGAWSPWSTFF